MGRVHDGENLSWGDAAFLYLERKGSPLHIASVNVFEGIIPLEACRQFIDSKLPLIPRYRQRIVAPPLDIGLPSWRFDPSFDIRNHVKEVQLKRGTEAELKAAAGEILSAAMDREHPPWDIHLLRGLKGDRTAVLTRVHHCLADGVAGVGMMNVIMDPSPIPAPLPKKKVKFTTPPPQDLLTSALDGLVTSYFSAMQRLLSTQAEVMGFAENLVSGRVNLDPEALARLLPELTSPTQRLPFNVVCEGPQNFAWAEIPLAQIKAIKDKVGATVNDVILTTVTLAIRHYAQMHGVNLKGRLLRIVVPVNVRGTASASPGELGNRISFIPVTIPLDIADPGKLLAAVCERMMFLKSVHAAELVSLAGSLIGLVPTAIQALAGPIASQLPISICNVICTNVPGPQIPLYLLGHKMLSWYPYVPIGGEMGINTAVLSYNNSVFFGFTGDSKAAPDLMKLETFVKRGFTELRKSAGVSLPRKKREKVKVQAPAASAEATPPVHRAERHSHTPTSTRSEEQKTPVAYKTAATGASD